MTRMHHLNLQVREIATTHDDKRKMIIVKSNTKCATRLLSFPSDSAASLDMQKWSITV